MSSDTKWIIGTMLAGMTAMTALLLTVITEHVLQVLKAVQQPVRVVCGRGRNPTVRVFTLNVGRHVATGILRSG